MQLLRSNKIMFTLFFLCLLSKSILGQITNHTFPRIAIWQWGGAVPDWYAKFDFAMTRIADKSFVEEVRQKNSDIIWLPTQDFNTAYDFIPNFPDEWYLVDSKGSRVGIHYAPDAYYADLSDLGVKVNGQRLIDFYSEYLAQLVSDAGADGIASDGLFYRGHLNYNMWGDVDLDRNGVNDLAEHGKSWVIDHWAQGVDILLGNLRSLLGNNKIIMINSGSSDTPGEKIVNGFVHEYGGNVDDWNWERSYWTRKSNAVKQPPIFLQQSNPDTRASGVVYPTKNDLRFMRFSLVKAMLLGRYYSFEHVDRKSPDHMWNNYFDEFDLDIGYPTGSMQEVNSGVWARFFDGGAAIANFSGSDKFVSDQDLRSLSGYNGPYHRFLGGQDMALNGTNAMNNGQQFNSVNLSSYSYTGYNDASYITGDGVILVKTLQTVVSNIIIDNVESGTSPVSEPARLIGSFTQADCRAGADYYKLRCDTYTSGAGSFAVATDGGGEAIFTPIIGVTAKYEVYEWHGTMPGTQASNVSYIINHAGGSTTKTVNQQINAGQWNSLGTYTFNKGTSGNVTISSNGADGPVMADAIKFVFGEGNSGGDFTDTTPPATPQNIRVGN